jgi:6-phosphofructo-2-kinase/fructose-2,6-biphosphatase
MLRYPNGESYLDVIQRLEPVVIEIEREKESVVVIAHQAILRALYGYFTRAPLADIPTLEIPLHTVIELTPNADGTMTEERFETGVPTTKQVPATAAFPHRT